MSAIRVLRTRRENNVQQGDATLPGGDLDPGPGPHLDQNVLAGYATVALASILDPSGGLFSDAARPGQCPFSYWAQTWHSKIAIRDESQKGGPFRPSSASLVTPTLANPANRAENLTRLCSATICKTGWRMVQYGASRSRLETLKQRSDSTSAGTFGVI